jgi:hypothetical protein
MMLMISVLFLRRTDQNSLYRRTVVVVLVARNGMDVQFKMTGWMLKIVPLRTFIQFTK